MTKMHNPVNFLSLLPLFPAEKEFVRCLAAGKSCEVGNGKLPQNGIKFGEGANVVRGEVIRFFAYGGDKEHFVRGTIIKLQGAWICGKDPMDLKYVRAPYALQFIDCHFTVGVEMRYARCAALHLCGSRFKQKLHANWLTTKGAVRLNDGFSAEDGVQLLGANIGGDFSCAKGEFRKSGKEKYALDVAGLVTKGSVFFNDGFSAEGEVRLLGASIAGKLDCAGGRFNNTDEQGRKYALNAEQVKTGGHVYLNKHVTGGPEPFSARGRVRFANADIGRNFNCKGGEFRHSGDGSVIAAGGLRSRGAVFLSDQCIIQGDVDLHVAQIGNFVCKECKQSKGVINLLSTKAVAVDDDANAWRQFQFVLDGFTYDTFFGEKTPKNKRRLKWLTSRPKKRCIKGKKVKVPFSPLPYEQAAKVMFGMGRVRDAREILLEKERLQTKYGQIHWLRKVGRRLWNVFAGYGYRLSYTAAWMLGIVAVGAVIFGVADRYGNIVPTHPVVVIDENYRMQVPPKGNLLPTQAAPPEYPAFNPLVFSLDVFTPSAVFHQEDSWGPRAGEEVWWVAVLFAFVFLFAALALYFSWFAVIVLLSWLGCIKKRKQGLLCGCGLGAGVIIVFTGLAFLYVGFLNILWLLTLWYWLEVAMGWILTSMLLLSVAGLLRPRQSSSEKD